MARHGEVPGHASRYCLHMQSRYVNGLTIRSLRDGDTETVSALFARLGEIDAIAFGGEKRLEHLAHDLFVVDDKD